MRKKIVEKFFSFMTPLAFSINLETDLKTLKESIWHRPGQNPAQRPHPGYDSSKFYFLVLV